MEAKDLMIGDKLKTTFSQKKVKVKEIKQNCIYTEDNGYEYNEIEPIPLTPEILEKNGFVLLTDLWYLTTKERKPIHVVFKDNNVITLSINATPVPIGLKYVHQLQHALRLYGIEKEIIL